MSTSRAIFILDLVIVAALPPFQHRKERRTVCLCLSLCSESQQPSVELYARDTFIGNPKGEKGAHMCPSCTKANMGQD
jgi:hypothetical protein